MTAPTVILLAASLSMGAIEYQVVDLGTLAGASVSTHPGSVAHAVSTDGGVVGTSVLGDLVGETWAFRWTGGALDPLAPLVGDAHSVALDANGSGLVIGQSFNLGDVTASGVVWDGSGAITDLGAVEPRAINDAGLIVGRRMLAGGSGTQALVLGPGGPADIPTLGGPWNTASDVNSSGDVVGHSHTAGGAIHAFLASAGGGAVIDLGTLGGATSQAMAIDEARRVVGWSLNASGETRAFLFEVSAAGAVTARTDLGALSAGTSSYARSINAGGEIVGTSDSRAVRWRDGLIVDLNTLIATDSEWELHSASSINDAGAIAGFGLHDGQWRSFLLTPAICSGDVDGDGDTDVFDFGVLSSNFGAGPGATRAQGDLNGDGHVNVFDFADLSADFGCGA